MNSWNKALFIAVTTASMWMSAWVHAEANRVTFPENIDELVHYTTVKRGNVTEHILTSQAALDAVNADEPVPFGTHFVLADYREGAIHRYFVMQKGEGWGNDYDERRRTADWQFQWFKPDLSINLAENTQRCQSCHQSREDEYYLYTYDEAMSHQ